MVPCLLAWTVRTQSRMRNGPHLHRRSSTPNTPKGGVPPPKHGTAHCVNIWSREMHWHHATVTPTPPAYPMQLPCCPALWGIPGMTHRDNAPKQTDTEPHKLALPSATASPTIIGITGVPQGRMSEPHMQEHPSPPPLPAPPAHEPTAQSPDTPPLLCTLLACTLTDTTPRGSGQGGSARRPMGVPILTRACNPTPNGPPRTNANLHSNPHHTTPNTLHR